MKVDNNIHYSEIIINAYARHALKRKNAIFKLIIMTSSKWEVSYLDTRLGI